MKRRMTRKGNKITLIVEIVLTVAICCGIAFSSFVDIAAQSRNFAAEITRDYQTITKNYMRDFKVIRMEAEEQIKKDLSFDEMQAWLEEKDSVYQDAMGENVFDGFAFTYKGGYVHSWNYGDYSAYVPASRPWYQIAEEHNGEVAVVAPYVTYLSDTHLIERYDTLRLSIVQKYNEEIFFDLDLDVSEINELLTDKSTSYEGTLAFLYDKDGYILSSTNENMYGHNMNMPDEQISEKLSKILENRDYGKYGMILKRIDGSMRLVYSYTDSEGKTLCMLVPFALVFTRNFLFVLLLACCLIVIEIVFYHRNLVYQQYLEANKRELGCANRELKVANSAKSDFLSRMSHDIRTPLNGIIGMTQIAQHDNQDETVAKSLAMIASSGKFLLSLINDVLDISKIESGKMELHEEPVALAAFDSMIASIIQPLMDAKNITFYYQMNCGMQCACIDILRFNQIFFNLLSNAAKFTPDGGTVWFRAECLSTEETIEWVRFFVKDTGIGMTPEFLTHAFAPFEQDAESNSKLQLQGTGLGLSISKELVELMGGSIQVQSEVGKGSEFFVDLPLKKTEMPDEQEKQKKSGQTDTFLRGRKLLLAEDNHINAIVASRLLEAKEMTVVHVTDGEQAVRAFQEHPMEYDAILMDIRMPVLSGLDAAAQIRKSTVPRAQTIPIIAMTANAFDEDIQACKKVGMNAHLAKPIDTTKMFTVIAEQLMSGG